MRVRMLADLMEGNTTSGSDMGSGGSKSDMTPMNEFAPICLPRVRIQLEPGPKSFSLSRGTSVLVPSSKTDTLSSPCLEFRNLVKSNWTERKGFLGGRYVASHYKGVYLAHVSYPATLNPATSSAATSSSENGGGDVGVIRVMNRKTEERHLIRGIKGKVADLAFSQDVQTFLGCIDEFGNVYIYRVGENARSKLCVTTVLEFSWGRTESSQYNLICWRPAIWQGEVLQGSSSRASMFGVSHDKHLEVFNLNVILQKYGSGPLEASSISEGRIVYPEHESSITAIQISPDGTAVAFASTMGLINFYQIYLVNPDESKRMHFCKPYGKISTLIFPYDHSSPRSTKDYWNCAIIGSERNNVLRLWSTDTWNCIQTIEIDSDDSIFVTAFDPYSKSLVLSDVVKNVLYVFQLQGTDDALTRITSVAEFATFNPFLSLAILNSNESDSESDVDSMFEDLDDEPLEAINNSVIQFYLIQPRALQLCRVTYNSPSEVEGVEEYDLEEQENGQNLDENNRSMNEKVQLVDKNDREDIDENIQLINTSDQKIKENNTDLSASVSPQILGITLPPLFKLDSSKDKKDDSDRSSSDSPVLSNRSKEKYHFSRSSSPSREVQDILGDSNGDFDAYERSAAAKEDDAESLDKKYYPYLSSSPPSLSNSQLGHEAGTSEIFLQMNSNEKKNTDITDSEAIMSKLNQLMAKVEEQSFEIDCLRKSMKNIKTPKLNVKNFYQQLKDHEKSLSFKVNTAIKTELHTFSSTITSRSDKELREALQKVINSKHMPEAVGVSVAKSLQPAIQNAFIDSLMNIVVPAFDRSCQNLFSQVSVAFAEGIKDYEAQLKKTVQENFGLKQDALFKELREILASVRDVNENMKCKDETVIARLKEILSEDSCSATPAAPSSDSVLMQILSYVNSKHYDEAFKLALSVNSLPIAIATCELVDPIHLFGDDCPLQQSVLLSLIQQLGHDLEENTQLKYRYLKGAITNIDTTDPELRYHAIKIAPHLEQNILNYIEAHPSQKLSKNFKLLLAMITTFY